ncbi:MAG TPA: murein biosynthesis integral membrane protein MurJ [Pseudolysinimonas sp.]|nr:murein biosynthesis integral membrane protein MurJ [Pseudolysinimonas sp.]
MTTPPDLAVDPAQPGGGMRRASAVLAAGTMVSRILGFASAAVLAWTIGNQNAGANAFALANQLPNNIYAIIAGGLLSAVLVPQIVRAGLHSDGGQRFVNKLVTLGVVIFLLVTLAATLCAPLLVGLYTLGSDNSALDGDAGVTLAVTFAYYCLPQIFFYAIYSLLGEVLNARGVFGPFTWAPVLNNVIVIASLLAFAAFFGTDPAHRDPTSWTAAETALMGGGATLGVLSQAAILLAFWRRTGLGFRPDFRWKGVGLGATGRAAGWTFGMILITQLAGIVQSNVAFTAGAGDASVAVLRNAWLIFMLPHSIIAVSIATPYFTRMSAHARDGNLAAVRADLSSSLRTIGLLVTGASVALAAAALPFAAVFANSPREVIGIGGVLLAFLLGLVPFSVLFLLQRAYYSLGDTRTPFVIQVGRTVLFVAGALLVWIAAPEPQIAAGIALVTSLAGIITTVVAAVAVRHKLGGIDGRRLLRRFGVYLLATIPAAAAGLGILALLGGFPADGSGFAVSGPKINPILSVAAVSGVTMAVYLGVLLVARVPEVRELTQIVARLRGRR